MSEASGCRYCGIEEGEPCRHRSMSDSPFEDVARASAEVAKDEQEHHLGQGARRLPGTHSVVMTTEQAAERERADAACRAAAIAHRYMAEAKRERDRAIAEAVRLGEAPQVARRCDLSRQQVHAIAKDNLDA